MKTISKKCQPPYFQQIVDGIKKFEIRLNDDKYEVGDTLLLKEWCEIPKNPLKHTVLTLIAEKNNGYTGRAVACRITSIVHLESPGCIVIDGHEWYNAPDIAKYGLAVLSIEVVK